jgi:type I restriction enzyme M protein
LHQSSTSAQVGYISTAVAEEEINLKAVHADLVASENKIAEATEKHNEFLKQLGLPLLPIAGQEKGLGKRKG